MKILHSSLLALCLTAAGHLQAEEAAAPAAAAAPALQATTNLPMSLFNGKDLSGWHSDVPEKDKNPNVKDSFIVRDGMLVSLGNPGGHLITDAIYENYRLEVQYRFAGKPGNCGVLVHASKPRALYGMFPQSIECQMQHTMAGDFWCIEENIEVPDMEKRRPKGKDQKFGGGPNDARQIWNLTDNSEKPVGEWNTMIIECKADTVKIWVNGDFVNEGTKSTVVRGQIALQAEGSEVEFRKVELTRLDEQKVVKAHGFKDTPILPGTKWHVHDPDRPQPVQVKGECRTTPAPAGAKVLFDGKSLDAFSNTKWEIKDGAMVAKPGGGSQVTKEAFGDCQLHLEFMIPKSCCKGDQSGNSGVFLMGLYEIQILNGWESCTYADGTIGAIYGQTPPLVKACNPPDEWNSYDITFTAPKFDADGKLLSPAKFTALLNGVLVQNGTESQGPCTYRGLAHYSAHAPKLPLQLQDHGDPVNFRNIWIKDL